MRPAALALHKIRHHPTEEHDAALGRHSQNRCLSMAKSPSPLVANKKSPPPGRFDQVAELATTSFGLVEGLPAWRALDSRIRNDSPWVTTTML